MMISTMYHRIDRARLAHLATRAGFGGVSFHQENWLMDSFEKFAALVQEETISQMHAAAPALANSVAQEEWR